MSSKKYRLHQPRFLKELLKHVPKAASGQSQKDSEALQADPSPKHSDGERGTNTGGDRWKSKSLKMVQKDGSGSLHDMAEVATTIAQANDALSRLQSPGKNVLLDSENVTPIVRETSSIVDFWKPVWDKLEVFVALLEGFGELHPYAKMASKILLSVVKPVIAQNDRDKAMFDLRETMCDVYDFVNEALRGLETLENCQKKVLLRMSQQVMECAYFIRDQSNDTNFYIRAAKNALIGEQIEETMKRFIKTFEDLKRAFMERGVLKAQITTFCILRTVNQMNARMVLQDLVDMPEWGMVPNLKGCLPGTRVEILDSLSQFINEYHLANCARNPRVCFLVGGAGVGKSAIAHGIGKHFRELGRLASFFRFDRSIKGDIQINSIFKVIAKQLAGWNPGFKLMLQPGSVAKMDIESQWRQLILEPAQDLQDDIVGPVLIMIDALDECGTSRSRRELLAFLTTHSADLPPNFRIIVTSRPEQDIMCAIKNNTELVQLLDLQHHQDGARRDVDLYIRDWLKAYEEELGQLTEVDYNALSIMADGLFQWAFTACKFMVDDLRGGLTLSQRFKKLCAMNPSGLQGLDTLYSSILKEKFMSEDSDAMERFHLVMAEVLAAAEPLSFSSLHTIYHHSNNILPEHLWCCSQDDFVNGIKLILREMGALLIGVLEDETPIKPFHTSFHDFLTNEDRSKEWYINVNAVSPFMALGCFRIMNDGLYFNVCYLSSSFLSNDEMASNNGCSHGISLPLKYACLFWRFHLKNILNTTLGQEIIDFVKQKLLFWFEVLSVLHVFNIAGPALATLYIALRNTEILDMNETIALVYDAIKFAKYFAPAITHSAPHIYISALMFAPKESILANIYGPQYKKTFLLQSGQLTFWPAQQAVLRGHTDLVTSVAYSPNGKFIVSGSWDQTIKIWDAETGQAVGRPLEGHTQWITSVAFSPDGKYIVSGSGDMTVQVWNADTGQPVGKPFEGHTAGVSSVVFFSDGKYIISSSGDLTIRVWNVQTGQSIGKPLRGHMHEVTTIAVSPNGKYIVSGSGDCTLRIWNSKTGQSVGEPLTGHTQWITSVAFSPDGKHIVSGSSDQTLRIWNIETRQTIIRPLEGHTCGISSVAFSLDGKYVVSGSGDLTVRLWNVQTGQAVGKPLEGHTQWITSVAFSPHGKYIVSGSDDQTLRIWDIETEQSTNKPLDGHSQWITAVAFSPDGRHIVSGSDDQTLRIWDVKTGQPVSKPLEGHTQSITTVTFSPNGKYIISSSSDQTLQVWYAETGQPVDKSLENNIQGITLAAFSPDRKYLISHSLDQTLQVWNVETWQPIGKSWKECPHFFTSVALSSDGKYIAFGLSDSTLQIWNAEIWQPLDKPGEGHTQQITSITFSPDGKYIASGSSDRTLRIWSTETRQPIGKPLKGHIRGITSVSFSPDGKSIISSSSDQTVQIWNVENEQFMNKQLEGHTQGVTCIAFSSDGNYIVSGSGDQTLRVWTAKTGQHIAKPLQITSVIFSYHGSTSNVISHVTTQTLKAKTSLQMMLSQQKHQILQTFFNEYALISDNGWVYGPRGELLLWVPPLHRSCLFPLCLHYRDTVNVLGSYQSQVQICNSTWGGDWTLCNESNTC